MFEEKNKSFRPKVSGKEKVKKTKAYKYATSSLFGSIAYALFFQTMLIGLVIAFVSVIYAIISIRLAMKDKDQSTATKSFISILIVVLIILANLIK